MDTSTVLGMTFVIIAVIAVLTIAALRSDNARFVGNAPSILTSLGIFGTFLGITVGLAGFDPNQIAESVPRLFNGIKLAFWTSVAGILGGILVRFRLLRLGMQEAEAAGRKATADDVVEALESVKTGLTDPEKSPLLTSLKELRESTASQSAEQVRNMAEAIQGLQTTLSGDSEEMLAKLEAMSAASDGVGERISQSVRESMDASRQAMGEEITRAVTELRDALVGPDGAASALGEGLTQGREALAKSLTVAVDGLQKAMASDLNKLGDRLAEGSSLSAEQLNTVGAAVTGLREALGSDAAQVLNRLDALTAGSEKLGERMGQALAESNSMLAKAIEANRDAMAAQVTAAVTELRDALIGPDGAATLLGKGLREGQTDLAEALVHATDGLRAALAGDLGAISSQLAAGSEDTAEQMRQVGTAIGSLREALGGDSMAMLEKLEAVRSGLAEGSDSTTAQVKGVAQAIAGLKKSMGDDAAATLEKLEVLRKGLKDGSDDTASHIGRVSEAIGTLREAMGSDAVALLERLESLRDSLAEGDANAATQMRGIGEAIVQLRDAMGSDSAALIEKLDSLREGMAEGGADTAAQMRGIGEAVMGLREALGSDSASLLDKVEALRQGSEAAGERIGAALSESNAALAKILQTSEDAMLPQITKAVTEMRNEWLGPKGLAAEMRELMRGTMEGVNALNDAFGAELGTVGQGLDALTDAMQGMGEGLSGAFAEMGGGLSGDINTLASGIGDAIDDLRLALVGPDGMGSGIVDEIRKAQDRNANSLEQLCKALVGPDGMGHGIAEEIRQAQDRNVESLDKIVKALEENTQRQIDYSPKGLMQALEELINQFNTQFSSQFWEKLGGFNQGVAELITWMETYRKQLTTMVDQQTKAARNMDTTARRFDEVASRSEIFIDVSKNISSLLGGLDSQRVQMESHLKRFAHIVDVTSEALQSIEERIIAGNAEMSDHMRDISDRIEEQVIRVDSAMEDELTKAMNSFGQQLASLSEKFAADYTPLTERLQALVKMAEKL